MNNSAERLCLPTIPEDLALQVLTEFGKVEQDWTPSAPGTSLYLRPFMFGSDETLGVHAVQNATYMIIASPVGSYYKEGINPVKIMIEDEDVPQCAAAQVMLNAAATMPQATAPASVPSKRAIRRCFGLTVLNANTLKKSAL